MGWRPGDPSSLLANQSVKIVSSRLIKRTRLKNKMRTVKILTSISASTMHTRVSYTTSVHVRVRTQNIHTHSHMHIGRKGRRGGRRGGRREERKEGRKKQREKKRELSWVSGPPS